MTAKKIGRAKADPQKGLWVVGEKPERFTMNQRLVDLRPDIKALKAGYSRHVHTKQPSKKRRKEREEYQDEQKNLKAQMSRHLVQVYAEILQESFSSPISLRKDRDTDHRSDWRYGLYQGIIYQFDRPGYGSDEMIERISQCQK